MTVISSKEFATNQNKYFELAMNEQVYIENGENIFVFSIANGVKEPDMIFEPDEDFYKSITMEEVREKLHNVINKLYENK